MARVGDIESELLLHSVVSVYFKDYNISTPRIYMQDASWQLWSGADIANTA